MMKDRRTRSYLLTLYSYFTLGCMVLTVNTALKSLMAEFGWSGGQGGLLISFMSAGNLLTSVLTGFITGRLGRQRTMMLWGGLIALSFVLITLLPTPVLFYPLMLLAGFSWGGVNSIDNTVVSELYDGSASRLNVMHACYAIGAVLMPLVMSFILLRGGSWRVAAWIVAALGVGLVVMAWRIPLPSRPAPAGESERTEVPFLRELGFYLGMVMFFTYVGVETAASAWLPSYLSQADSFFRQVPAETMVSLLWLTIIVGRLVFAAVGTRLNKRVVLVALSAGFLLGMAGLVCFTGHTVLLMLSVAFMGLSMSAMYATCVANNARYMAGSTVAPGLLFGMGGLGSAAVPYLAGLVSDLRGLRAGMASLCVFLAALLAAGLLNLLTQPRKGERP